MCARSPAAFPFCSRSNPRMPSKIAASSRRQMIRSHSRSPATTRPSCPRVCGPCPPVISRACSRNSRRPGGTSGCPQRRRFGRATKRGVTASGCIARGKPRHSQRHRRFGQHRSRASRASGENGSAGRGRPAPVAAPLPGRVELDPIVARLPAGHVDPPVAHDTRQLVPERSVASISGIQRALQ
jgi:hypothetical protein